MRIQTILVLTALAVSAAGVGCGANEVDMGAGGSNPTPSGTVTGTPTPNATPNPALFAAVQTFLEDPVKANCGTALCHVAPAGQAGRVFYTAPATIAGDVAKNRDEISCSDNIDDYSPNGVLIATFCNADGTAQTAPQHVARTNLVNADCAALFAWLETGTGIPPACL